MPIFNIERLPIELFLFTFLLAVSTLGVTFWSHRLKEEGRMEATQQMTKSWNQKLDSVSTRSTQELQTQREKYDAKVDAVQRRLGVALVELRKRPSRANATVAASGACPAVPACTGDRLAAEDAGFLVRYAAGVAVLAAKEKEARDGYDTCRVALKNITSGKGDNHESGASSGVPGP